MSDAIGVLAAGDWLLAGMTGLLGAGVRGIVLLGVVLLGTVALRPASAAARHAFLFAGFVAMLMLPVGMLIPWELPVLPSGLMAGAWSGDLVSSPAQGVSEATARAASPSSGPAVIDDDAVEASAAPSRPTTLENVPVGKGAVDNAATESASRAPATAEEGAGAGVGPARGAGGSILSRATDGRVSSVLLLLAVWLLGQLFVGGRLLAGQFRAARLIRRADPVTSGSWMRLLWESSDRLEVDRDVELLRSEESEIAFTTGVLHPRIVLPASADEWDEQRRRAVLMHELAHIQRRDLLAHHASRVATMLYWFNPFAWIVARRLRAESERAADDLVIGAGTLPSDYANHLLQIVAGARRVSMPGPVLPLARRREFEGRILAILEPRLRRTVPSRWETAACTAGMLLLAIPLAALAPAGEGGAERSTITAESTVEGGPGGENAIDPGPGVEGAIALRQGDLSDRESGVAGKETHSSPATVQREEATATAESAVSRPSEAPVARSGAPEATSLAAAATTDADAASPSSTGAADGRDRRVPVEDFEHLGETIRTSIRASGRAANWAASRSLDFVPDLPDVAIEGLVSALGVSDPGVRGTAAWTIGNLDEEDPRTVAALIHLLQTDSVAEVRATAAYALAELEAPEAVPALGDALRGDPDPKVRVAAAFALGEIEDSRGVDALSVGVTDADPNVRRAAINALADIESSASAPALVSALGDPDPMVRRLAAITLGEIDLEQAPQELIDALSDQDPEVRAAAARAIGEIEDPAAADALGAALDDVIEEVRSAALDALVEIHSELAVDPLIDALDSDDPHVRQRAAHALGDL